MSNGFTLIETLVALVILAIIVPVILEAQISTIKAEQNIRASESVALEIDRVLVKAIFSQAAPNQVDDNRFACTIIRYIPSEKTRDHEINADMAGWEITPKDTPSFRISVFTLIKAGI